MPPASASLRAEPGGMLSNIEAHRDQVLNMRFLSNIRVRMTLWYLLIVVVLVAFSATVAYVLLSRGLELKTVYPWDMRTSTIERSGSGISVGSFSDVFPAESNSRGYKSVRGFETAEIMRLASEGGAVKIGTLEGEISIDAKSLVYAGMMEDSETWLYLYGSADNPGFYRLVQVNQTVLAKELRLASFVRAILITAALALVLAGVLGFFLVSRMLRPVRAITRTAREIQENNLSRRLEVRTTDEIGDLASTLNQTFSRLEAAFVPRARVHGGRIARTCARRWPSRRARRVWRCGKIERSRSTGQRWSLSPARYRALLLLLAVSSSWPAPTTALNWSRRT